MITNLVMIICVLSCDASVLDSWSSSIPLGNNDPAYEDQWDYDMQDCQHEQVKYEIFETSYITFNCEQKHAKTCKNNSN